jgi:hypothetical protein
MAIQPSAKVHSYNHSPLVTIYGCYQCGRVTMKVTDSNGRQTQDAANLSQPELRALISKFRSALRGDIPVAPEPAHVTAPLPHTDW